MAWNGRHEVARGVYSLRREIELDSTKKTVKALCLTASGVAVWH